MPALPHDAALALAHAWVEPARPTDAEDLSALTHRSKAHWGYTSEQLASWASELTITPAYLESHAVYVVRRPSHWYDSSIPALLGFYAYAPTRDETVLLDNLFVDPLAMQHGLGRRLLEDFILATRQAAYRAARVVSDPHAVDFYAHFGFRPLAGEGRWHASGANRKLPVLERPLMPVPGTLDGERVQLVPAVPADMRRIYGWLENAWDHMGHSKSEALGPSLPAWSAFQASATEACRFHAQPAARQAYILEHEHAPVGQISFISLANKPNSAGLPSALLLCWMADLRLTRRGYGSDAIRSLCWHLHHQRGFQRFVIAVQKDSMAYSVAFNLGFREEDVTLPNHLLLPNACTMVSAWPLTSF